jgi:hypothetical protein
MTACSGSCRGVGLGAPAGIDGRLGSGATATAAEPDRAVGVVSMLRDVVSVEPLADHRLHVGFDDVIEGVVDIAQMIQFSGVFEPLRDPAFFAQAKVHPELGTIYWPNDADLDSEVLYAKVTGTPIPEYVSAKK